MDKRHEKAVKRCKETGKFVKKRKMGLKTFLILQNVLIWTFVMTGMDKTHTFTLSNVVEEAQASETPDPCGLEVVDCVGTGEEPEGKPSQSGTNMDSNRIEAIISETFADGRTAIAVAKAESGLNPRAKSYNCRYNGRSTFCREGDEKSAWSADCGVYQINTIGSECPEKLMDPIENIRIAKKMHDSRGWTPWVAWKNMSFKKYL